MNYYKYIYKAQRSKGLFRGYKATYGYLLGNRRFSGAESPIYNI